ncbi:MAG: hypothetical protein Q9213_000576 [Squamulea squamosa]
MVIAPNPLAPTEGRPVVAAAVIIAVDLAGNDDRVFGVLGTATQYHFSSFKAISQKMFLLRTLCRVDNYGKGFLTLIFSHPAQTSGFHFTKSASENVPNIMAIDSQVSEPVI